MTTAWHRIFGLALTQYFAGTAWKVDVEVDLSLQQQRLDVAILRHTRDGPEPVWPDGFGPPAAYNLLTFKALKDALDAWAIKELMAHGVNYRKQLSPDHDRLLPESDFRLLAASMHFPRGLAARVDLRPQGPGAYDVQWGTDTIRVLVMHEMPAAEQNIVWNLFSNNRERVAAGFACARPHWHKWSSLINKLLAYYELEGISMPYTMEDFQREVTEEVLQKLTPEQLLQRLTVDQRLAGLSPEQVLAHWSVEEIANYLKKRQADHGKGSQR